MHRKQKNKQQIKRISLISFLTSSLIFIPIITTGFTDNFYSHNFKKHPVSHSKNTDSNQQIVNFDFNDDRLLLGFTNHNPSEKVFQEKKEKNTASNVFESFSIKKEAKTNVKITPGFLKPGPIQWNYKSNPQKAGYNFLYDKIVHPGRYWNRITGNPEQIVQNVRIGYWNLTSFDDQADFSNIAKTILDTKSSLMALSENIDKNSDLNSSKILENLNSNSENSKSEWVQVSSKNEQNQENESKKYSFFYKKNELKLSGKHIRDSNSDPFLVSDQQINNTFPVALGFKALNNNKEFLVIMGNFVQKGQEKEQKPQENTEKIIKESEEKLDTKQDRIYDPVLFSDEEKTVIKQAQNSQPTKKLAEIIEEFKKKSGISEVIFLTSTDQNRKLGTGLGKENFDALINNSNKITNGLMTQTQNLVKKIESNNSGINSPLVVDFTTGLYFKDQTTIEIEGEKLQKLRLGKIPEEQKDVSPEDADKPENSPEDQDKNSSNSSQDQDKPEEKDQDKTKKESDTDKKVEERKDKDASEEEQNKKPEEDKQESDKEKEQKLNENGEKSQGTGKKPTENQEKRDLEKPSETPNLVRFGFWNIDKYGFSNSTTNRRTKVSTEESNDDSALELIFEVFKKMNPTVAGLVLKDVSKKNIENAIKKLVQKLENLKNKSETQESIKTPVSENVDSKLRRTAESESITRWKYEIYDQDEVKKVNDEKEKESASQDSGSHQGKRGSKKTSPKKSKTGKRKFLFLYDSEIWKMVSQQAEQQINAKNPFISFSEKIGSTERMWRNPPVGVTFELIKKQESGENAKNGEKNRQVTFVLGSFDSEGATSPDEKQTRTSRSERGLTSSRSTELNSRSRSRSRGSTRSKMLESDSETQSDESISSTRTINSTISKISPDFSKYTGQGLQELTEATNLKDTLDQFKKDKPTQNLLFAGTTNIKRKHYSNVFEDLLKSYSQLMPTNQPTKIFKKIGYSESMNSMFYTGQSAHPNVAQRIDWYGLEGYTKNSEPEGPKDPETLKQAFEKYVNGKSGSKKSKKSGDSQNWDPLKTLSNHAPIVVDIDFNKPFDKSKFEEQLKKEQGKSVNSQTDSDDSDSSEEEEN
ncbi:hypothetical protein [Mesomycoplasma dispar]|uniref:Uncharacterized protein n=1 Tax=Mesomycoplasma dispar TaxID=86660 RepID=A0ABM6PRX5_9BACT|nr:hypothetical protein [Mesomycoplasma dispar]ATP59902.1 hypothetical protein CSW10_03125 [Mesomycoplasma dispar]